MRNTMLGLTLLGVLTLGASAQAGSLSGEQAMI